MKHSDSHHDDLDNLRDFGAYELSIAASFVLLFIAIVISL